MASVYKSFNQSDIINSRSLLHESIPITGALASSSYGSFPSENNVKNYAHGMFQDLYDYPYLSSSANQICSITVGYSNNSALSSSTNVQNAKKINMYNQMAKILMGVNETGSIQRFDQDGNLLAGGTKLDECIFLSFSRLLYKDEIKKGSFNLYLGSTATYDTANNTRITITDAGAENDFRVNSPAGEYGILSASAGEATATPDGRVGLIFYQAGVVVLTASVFMGAPTGSIAADASMDKTGGDDFRGILTGSEISGAADVFRHRLYNLSFTNTTELNSTIYMCRIGSQEFNYSGNATYLSGSKIRTKSSTKDEPISYITGIGIYDSENTLLGFAKLSEPLKKSPSNEFILRLRSDF